MFRLLLVSMTLFIFSCTSFEQSAKKYFTLEKPAPGVETLEEILERERSKDSVYGLIYGHLDHALVRQCSILRNQLYLSAQGGASGDDGKKLKEAALFMEQGYQSDDQSFLTNCQQILGQDLGQRLWRIALPYVRSTR